MSELTREKESTVNLDSCVGGGYGNLQFTVVESVDTSLISKHLDPLSTLGDGIIYHKSYIPAVPHKIFSLFSYL